MMLLELRQSDEFSMIGEIVVSGPQVWGDTAARGHVRGRQEGDVTFAFESLNQLSHVLAQQDYQRAADREELARRRRADLCRMHRKFVLWNVLMLVANLSLLVWNVVPLLWSQPPSMFTGFTLVVTVLCVRVTMNSVKALLECRRGA